MNDFTNEIFDWLKEIDEEEAAKIIEECTVDNFYVKTFLELGGEGVWGLYDIKIETPGKYYKRLSELSSETEAIENAIKGIANRDDIIIGKIEWVPKIGGSKSQKDKERHDKIIKHIDTEYVKGQLKIMNESISKAPHLAIGLAKELIETCCKSILAENQMPINKNWDLAKLVKETNKHLRLIPEGIREPERAQDAIMKILGGFSVVVQGITELRNCYGTGHGHAPNFKALDEQYARIAVAASSELAIFYLNNRKIIKINQS